MKVYNVLPIFKVGEKEVTRLSEHKVGDVFRALVNFEVVERTKSYVIIKIKHVHTTDVARKR